jgi:N-acetylmuramic acid 6-phosphate etherase
MTSIEKANDYLRQSHLYRLGMLPTEKQSPVTYELSQLSQSDLPKALEQLAQMDRAALSVLVTKADELEELRLQIQQTLTYGGRIFICGCGATGRLAIALESIWRNVNSEDSAMNEKVISFMAGGDVALVRSIENFEDHPEYGVRQLKELGFTSTDLFIGVTEGGETPYVIGATVEAARVSQKKVWFLFCNPIEELSRSVERSRQVLAQPNVRSVALETGPMALSGSTRMQASTVLMGAVGLALLHLNDPRPMHELAQQLRSLLGHVDYLPLQSFVEEESEIYKNRNYLFYEADDLGMAVLTDTTERHPTFSIPAFENSQDQQAPPSTCYLIMKGVPSAQAAWRKILGRDPRALRWPEITDRVSLERLKGFDFSEAQRQSRTQKLAPKTHYVFSIVGQIDGFDFKLKGLSHRWTLDKCSELSRQLAVKVLLNAHSTLVMGRFGRYTGNVMTWVKPSNGKLIDRAIRYVQYLFEAHQLASPSYEKVAYCLFEKLENLVDGESVVLSCYDKLRAEAESMTETKSILFFDGVCNLCNGFVDFIIARDTLGVFQFASIQGETAKRVLAAEDIAKLESVLVKTPAGVLSKSGAVLFILAQLPGWGWTQIFKLVPRFLRDLVYDFIAANRYRIFGQRETCRLPLPHEKERLLD